MGHRARWILGLAATAGLALPSLAGTAGAAPATLAQPQVRAGLKLIHPGLQTRRNRNTLTVRSSGTVGVVSPTPTVYLVFWGSQWSSDPAVAASALQNFFSALNGTPDTYDTIFTQYCEGVPKGTAICGTSGTHIQKPATTSLAGVWFDNTALAPTHATAAQIELLGLFWHFVDLVWILVFTIIYLIPAGP